MHKAVGWMLREAGKRDRRAAAAFLEAHAATMPRVMLRYAIEKLDKPTRDAWLARKQRRTLTATQVSRWRPGSAVDLETDDRVATPSGDDGPQCIRSPADAHRRNRVRRRLAGRLVDARDGPRRTCPRTRRSALSSNWLAQIEPPPALTAQARSGRSIVA